MTNGPSRVPSAVARGGGEHGGRAEAGDPPLGEQVAVVDPGRPVGHEGEGPAVGAGQEGGGDGVGEGDPAGRLAQRGGRRQGVRPGAGVEVAGPQRVEGAGHLAGPDGRVVLRPAGGVDPAEGGERRGRGGPELDGLVGEDRVHRAPPSSALATIIRWTSIVPEATVAAWA